MLVLISACAGPPVATTENVDPVESMGDRFVAKLDLGKPGFSRDLLIDLGYRVCDSIETNGISGTVDGYVLTGMREQDILYVISAAQSTICPT